jgi:hypothetical protein
MKAPASFFCPEPLEARIAPATLNLVSGALTYSGTGIIANDLTIAVSGANYTFNDPTENITLNQAAIDAGFTGGGTHSVTGPDAAVISLNIQLGSGDDTFTVNALNDPLAVVDAAGNDSVTIVSANPGGNVLIQAETVELDSVGGAAILTLTTDTLSIAGPVAANTSVVIQPLTANRVINLGSEVGTHLSLTASELAQLTAPKLTIGNASAGSILVNAAIDVATVPIVSLKTGGGITQSGAGAITVDSLAIDADSNVTLTGTNHIDSLAANVSDAGAAFVLTAAGTVDIDTVDGIIGLTTNTAAGGNITLNTGPFRQAANAPIIANGLLLLGGGNFSLSDAPNDVVTIAANVAGTINYTDATGLDVGTVGAVSGITSANKTLNLTTLAGNLHVLDAIGGATPDIDVGTGSMRLTAGTAGNDFAVVIDTNAGLKSASTAGISAVMLIADHLTIGATVDGGLGIVSLQPFETDTTINLGGADAAATLGITSAELNLVKAGIAQIGSGTTSPMTVSASITPANVTTLGLAALNVSGAGAITVANLVASTAGDFALTGANDVNFFTFTVLNAQGPAISFADANGFSLGVPSGVSFIQAPGTSIVNLNSGISGVSFPNGTFLGLELKNPTPGSGHDQIAVTGGVILTGAKLNVSSSATLTQGAEFVIVSNGSGAPVNGTFLDTFGAPLLEGATINVGDATAFITYKGGDGNDISIKTLPGLAVSFSADKKTATYRDVDGDTVTVKTSKGAFDGSEFFGIETGPNGAGQLQRLTLDSDFSGANITITAKPGVAGGNSFVNLGYLNATGVDLGIVNIGGDLGRLDAGTTGGNARVPGLKSLTVGSLGLLDVTTQPPGGQLGSSLHGALGTLTVKGDMRGSIQLSDMGERKIGRASIGGSMVAALLSALEGIGSLKVGGDLRASATAGVLIDASLGSLGAVTVSGSIVGADVNHAVIIQAYGRLIPPARGLDVAIKSLAVTGSVEFLKVFTGSSRNADASIGSITVGGDWLASSVLCGTEAGPDGRVGTADDVKIPGGGNLHDNPALVSTVGSITIKGQALGTPSATNDMFGIVAEKIGKAKVGTRTFVFKADAGATLHREAFFAAPSGPGKGAMNEVLPFDFPIREIDSLTPAVALGGADLGISSDGKTATYLDIDGDLVTVKRSAGGFAIGDFMITPGTAGGGQLAKLTISPTLNNPVVNLTITAKPGPGGGNGFVNVGDLEAAGVPLGTVTIAGDLGQFQGGLGVGSKPGTAALSVHSFGTFGSTTGAPSSVSIFTEGIGKLTVGADVRDRFLAASGANRKMGAVSIGGSLVFESLTTRLSADQGIGSVKIGGSVRGGSIISNAGALGPITIGGDLIGDGIVGNEIFGFGQITAPTKGLDVAIKSLTVKGNVENAVIAAGTGSSDVNADASIGVVSVGRAWLASSLIVGVDPAGDTFIGTSDDKKETGTVTTRDAARFSTIASITIKGQALGSAAVGDSFGIVAEQILKAKIGTRTFQFDKGERDLADAFATAPTGPGPMPDDATSDFFIREIVH